MGLKAAVTQVGVVSALGSNWAEVCAALSAGQSGLKALEAGPIAHGGRCEDPDLRPLLTRRRDLKIFSRSARLLLKAAADALEGWSGDREEVGLFFGIRKEPSDTGGGDAALVASVKDGRLNETLLASIGKRLSPPLLPLESLPNMCLAHVSIQLGLRGECGVSAGGASAGVHALREGIAAVAEGRSVAVLAGAVDSWVDGPSQRDWLRLGCTSPPGEAAIVLRLEPEGHPDALFHLERGPCGKGGQSPTKSHHALLGDCGAADALFALLSDRDKIVGVDEHGAWAEAKRVRGC
jgi:3-oxoacyl-(acyl-carrier-protein) synthase